MTLDEGEAMQGIRNKSLSISVSDRGERRGLEGEMNHVAAEARRKCGGKSCEGHERAAVGGGEVPEVR